MSGKRHTRWVGFDETEPHIGKDIVDDYSWSGDQLRGLSSSVRSMRAMLQNYPELSEFEPCINSTGSDHGIGFACGRLRESAACLKCRYFCRAQVLDWTVKREIFTSAAKLLTINDDPVSLGALESYKFEPFKERIASVAKAFPTVRLIGNLEFGLFQSRHSFSISTFQWLPHFHIVTDGHDADFFIEEIKRRLGEHDRKVSVSQKNSGDPNRAICYTFKSPYSKRAWKEVPTSKRRLELHTFFNRYSCSDLMILPTQYRVSQEHRVHVSPWKDIATWQTLASDTSRQFSGIELRVVPKPSDEYYQYAKQLSNELGLGLMLGGVCPPPSPSHLSTQFQSNWADRRRLRLRLKRYAMFGAR